MKFNDASLLTALLWRMRMADMPRGLNRARIDRLANGSPPMTEQERIDANANTNVNFLDFSARLADARRTFYGAHLKPGNFFNVTLNTGSPENRRKWGKIITTESNKILKGSKEYFELLRSQLAMIVVHGIGPVHWPDKETLIPDAVGIEDVLIPSNTLLTMKNLPHFAVFRQYTPMELYKLTHGKKVDPGWNMPMVEACIKWALKQPDGYISGNAKMYAPEKFEEWVKENSGYYGSDSIPTIDCWRFFFWSDEGKKSGWRQRIVLDTPSPGQVDYTKPVPMPGKTIAGTDIDWLYKPSDDRVYADDIQQIIHFQFGDASAVGPFRYHAVRSLGWLLYAVCHLQNRLRCKINDATFEAMMQYFRVLNPDDAERVTKIDLHNYGVIPEGVNFIQQSERWKIDMALAEMTTNQNRASMDEASAQYREGRDNASAGTEKTATQVMAEVNAANALVSGMLLQSYTYSQFQQMELCRRFCIKNSKDPLVRKFRVNVLKAGVPEDVLDSSLWNVEPERVMGSGNKILGVAMADKLMAARQLHDPAAQREILRIYDEENTDDPALADRLVPETPHMTDSVLSANNMIGSLMQGIQIAPAPGLNATEVIETLLAGMATVLKGLQSGQPSQRDIAGAANIGQTIGVWIQQLAQDETAKDKVKQYSADLATLNRAVDEIAAKIQPDANNGADPVTSAKVAAIEKTTDAKVQSNAKLTDAKIQQGDIKFQQKTAQTSEKHNASLQQDLRQTAVDNAAQDALTAADIKRKNIEAENKPEQSPPAA